MSITGIIFLCVYLLVSGMIAWAIWDEIRRPTSSAEAIFALGVFFFPSVIYILLWIGFKQIIKFVNYFLKLDHARHHRKKERIAKDTNES